jgi:hypothetical protein
MGLEHGADTSKEAAFMLDALGHKVFHIPYLHIKQTNAEDMESKKQKKPTKKQAVTDLIKRGMTERIDIIYALADQGILVSDKTIERAFKEMHVEQRIARGLTPPPEVRPYATSGITGNPYSSQYLEERGADPGNLMKTCVWDIEATGLVADFGYMLTCCIKNLDTGEIKVFRLDETEFYQKGKDNPELWNDMDYWEVIDMELCDQVRKELDKYMVAITWNGRWYDERFLQTRLMGCGLESLSPNLRQFDVMQLWKKVMNTKSNRQDAAKNFLKIDKEPDTHNWAAWRMAASGVKAGFDFICDHNVKDVQQLHEIAEKVKKHAKFWIF